MGRLIDANKAQKDFITATGKRSLIIDTAETVPAIPIDWIETKMKRLKDMENGYSCLAADILYGVLIDWRRERDGQTG